MAIVFKKNTFAYCQDTTTQNLQTVETDEEEVECAPVGRQIFNLISLVFFFFVAHFRNKLLVEIRVFLIQDIKKTQY